MAHYVILVNWTEKGVTEAKDTVQRAEQVQQMVAQMGGSMTVYWTMGRYDLVAICEAPDDETATAMALRSAGMGTVRTETLRAFTADEVNTILGKVG
jgi:uncharacterized protein with GYD domain